MTFYTQETTIGLLISCTPIVLSLFFFFFSDKKKLSWFLLFFGAFLLRLLMINLDPYLHEWDERYHALVAKNMMTHPFEPMLRLERIYGKEQMAWCCSTIWLHKQPLFLWQMAFSMKIFGVNLIAMRLPSAIMGTVAAYFVKDIAHFWTKNKDIAFLTAFLFVLTYFPLELTAGNKATEHNDIAFLFYVTASIWSFTRLIDTSFSRKWVVLTGVFVGCAILNKWLTGLLIFGGWGLYVLLDKELRTDLFAYGKILFSFLISCLVFLPWQLYTYYKYTVYYQREMDYNHEHIFEAVEGHTGSAWYHWDYLPYFYGDDAVYFAFVGLVFMLAFKKYDKKITSVFFALIAVIYLFFSVIVATKMPAFVLPVISLILTFIVVGFFEIINLTQRFLSPKIYTLLLVSVFTVLGYQFLKPARIISSRNENKKERNIQIHNDRIYQNLPQEKLLGKAVINVKCEDEVNLMFYKNTDAYCYYPNELELDSLERAGHRFVRFEKFHRDTLPDYLKNDAEVEVLEGIIRVE